MKSFKHFKELQAKKKQEAIQSIKEGKETSFKLDLSKKGKKNGLCNRSKCLTDKDVIYYNTGSHAWYCPSCAHEINMANHRFADVKKHDPKGEGFLCRDEEGYTPHQRETIEFAKAVEEGC